MEMPSPSDSINELAQRRRSTVNITENFRDERFKAYVLETFCGGRHWILASDVDRIATLELANHNYSSLSGIEFFVSLEELDCSFNAVTELDLSKNINLRSLDCRGNQLTALNTGSLPDLEKLSCNHNRLMGLELSRNPMLKELNCNKNELHGLDLKNNARLEALDCGFNRIRNLDVSSNAMLANLACYWNILSELHVDHNVSLKKLNCSYNALFDLNLDQNTRLTHVECANNYLISLNLKGCPDLVEIRCNHNHLTGLDVNENPALQSLRCFNNHITALDLSNNRDLIELYCSENKISKLVTSHLPKLERLDYSNNLMVEPDHSVEEFGTFRYEVSLSSYAMMLLYEGKELSVRANVSTEEEIKRLSPVIKKAWEHFGELIDQALNLIAEMHPDEDVSELVLSELEFDRDSHFRLGYDAGDTPAGQLYIYAAFNEKLEINNELIYETY
jgi:hypothetical protein